MAQHVAEEFAKGKCQPGDVILLNSFIYGAVTKIFKHYLLPFNAQIVEVPLPFPITDASDVVGAYRSALEPLSNQRLRLAVVDHISSIPSIIFPLKELSELFREHKVEEIFVDGAHAVGAIPLGKNERGAT